MSESLFVPNEKIAALKNRLANHEVYAAVQTLEDLRCFMEHHVFAVWDFMSLLKALQGAIAPARSPWLPHPHPELRRFINEIVLAEECDRCPESFGPYFMSHYELYLSAMREVGASTAAVEKFLDLVVSDGLSAALALPDVPPSAARFMRATFGFIDAQPVHCTAAAFALGRGDLIPEMFGALLDRMKITESMAPHFHYYLHRHAELDGDEHGPLSMKLVGQLCGDGAARHAEANATAEAALSARIAFWDDIVEKIAARNRG